MLIDTPTAFMPVAYAEKVAGHGNLDATYEEDAWTYVVEREDLSVCSRTAGLARVLVYDEEMILIGAL